MASWLTHLRIAAKIKERIKGIDLYYLMMGSIAPDSGVPDESMRNYTPSKEVTHYRTAVNNGIPDLNEEKFFNEYLLPEKIIVRSDSTRSFLWGYYFHLISDKMWLDEYFRSYKEQYDRDEEKHEKDFIDFIREEMNALDFSYLDKNGINILETLRNSSGNLSFFTEFDPEYILACRDRIISFYEQQPRTPGRELRFLNEEGLEDFINKASEKCIGILLN